MAMIGQALGNYLAILTGRLGQLLVSQLVPGRRVFAIVN